MSQGVATALAATAVTGCAAIGAFAWAVRGKSSSVFGPSVWHGTRGRNAIALTFDDGPSSSTPELLDILAEYRAPATFFQVGSNVTLLPDVSRAVLERGHELGNHSQTHSRFSLKPADFIQTDFERAQNTIEAATAFRPHLMRAPFGVRWFGFRQMQHTLDLTGVMWSVIARDWKLSAREIEARVLSRVADGDIICLHDGRGTLKDPDVRPTLEAVRRLVPALLERGYHFETVSQILCPMK
jgi:peptidoglycan/xylan/chitin deacetylase (PgdA/CDA1 family)